MQVITLILAALALAASLGALYQCYQTKRYAERMHHSFCAYVKNATQKNKKQQEAMLQYIDKSIEAACKKATEPFWEELPNCGSGVNKTRQELLTVNKKAATALKIAGELSDRIGRLEQGIVPDFNEALRAVNAVNDMNSGIASIFGFDPLEAIKKGRQEGG